MQLFNKSMTMSFVVAAIAKEKGDPTEQRVLPQSVFEVEDVVGEKLLEMYPQEIVKPMATQNTEADDKKIAELEDANVELQERLNEANEKIAELEDANVEADKHIKALEKKLSKAK